MTDPTPNAPVCTAALEPSKDETPRHDCPEAEANIFSRIFFTWVLPLVYRGWKQPINDSDLWELRSFERGGHTTSAVLQQWKDMPGGDHTRTANRLQAALFRAFRSTLLISGVLKAVDVVMFVLQPIFVRNLIATLAKGDKAKGLGWAIGLFLTPLFKTLTENNYFGLTMRTGMRVRSSLQGVLYDKSLRLSPAARASASLGEIVNLMQLDSQRIGDFIQFSHVMWAAPIQLIIAVALLYDYIGLSALIGLFFTVISVPIQGALLTKQIKLRKASFGITDKRVKLMNEILQGIKAVKFYAWESPFSVAVKDLRSEEVKKLYKTVWVKSAVITVLMALPALISVITFTFYAAVFDQELKAEKIFPGLLLLNNLRVPVMTLPMVFTSYIDARLGLKRIERLLDLEDTENYSRSGKTDKMSTGGDDVKGISSDSSELSSGSVSISGGEFEWSQIAKNPLKVEKTSRRKLGCLPRRKKQQKPDQTSAPDSVTAGKSVPSTSENGNEKYVSVHGSILRDIDLHFSAGQLHAIVGHVGSGKSSLLSAILGEMRKVKGTVSLEGSVAYVAQTAWIFHESLRNNIIFGKEFDEDLYKTAIEVSALEQDIAMLPAGDETAIGEKGINLSGGQKQRVSIARAVYAQADVYLFDDPLSALDAHVSQHVFDRCISNRGVLRDRLRILVTNQMHLLSDCDNVIFLHSGIVKGNGSFDRLAKEVPIFRELVDEQEKALEESKNETEEEGSANVDDTNQAFEPKGAPGEDAGKKPAANTSPNAVGRTLMQDEDRKTGKVVKKTYWQYVKALGNPLIILLLFLFFILSTALSLVVQWWLSYWSGQEAEGSNDTKSIGFYLGIYFGITILYIISTFLRSIWFMLHALHASKFLHNEMLASVLHAPLTFFDTTPIGRVLSRFSRDMVALDDLLPQFLHQSLNTTIQLVLTYVFIGIVLPPFFAAAAPVTIFYYILMRCFNRTIVELKRLDAISKSPIYAHFSETLGGLSTLRAYNKQQELRKANMSKIDINQRAYFTWIVTNRLYTVFLEVAGSFLVLAAALLSVYLDGADLADRGLVLTLVLQVTGFLGFTVRSLTELEGQMNSMERANYYRQELPQEAASVVEGATPQDWPKEGAIDFEDVTMRYREGLPLVLKGVNLKIKGSEKVGVVGRTGSGKSSMMIALLRMVELAGGHIRVDGIDLRSLGLDDVRSRITIIPQDPVMFSGTIRFNLDPFSQFADMELWEALEKSHMKQFVSSFPEGLDAPISEYGENLSAGQRQVICLTRALLRRSKILILDEASSSLDMETDRLIQQTIRLHLKHATILTIAHRLFTLADYDRVVVMQDGLIGEVGTPADLLLRDSGLFRRMVESMGPSGAAHFKKTVFKRNAAENN